MTRPDIEATLQSEYVGYVIEGVCAVLVFAILVVWVAIGAA